MCTFLRLRAVPKPHLLILFAAFAVSASAVAQDFIISSRFSNNLLRFHPRTGEFMDVFAEGGDLANPNGLALGPDNNLYVPLGDGSAVLRYDGFTSGLIDVFIGDDPNTPTDETGGLSRGRGCAFGPDGNLYVCSGGTDQILQYNGQTGAFLRVFSEHSTLDGPVGILFGPNGNLYVSSALMGRVLLFDGASGAFIRRFTTGATLNNPTGMTFGADGNFYVASGAGNQVQQYDADGNFLRVFATDRLQTPIGVMFGPDGLMYVASFGNDSVARFDPQTGAFMDRFVKRNAGGLDGAHYFVFMPCRTDFDGDGRIALLDLAIMLSEFGCTGGDCATDTDDDGDTDLDDLIYLLDRFGSHCPQ